ncbi:MAG: hypothetical protein GY791_08300 [Alphaproteobacteria bacterium]|nr:hypothetical protein [Alphaproteobacteria bacterium]
MFPDSNKKAAAFVVLLIPGFISLGLAHYVSSLSLGEYVFTYVALAISLLNGVLACSLVFLFRTARGDVYSFSETARDVTESPTAGYLLVLLVISVLVGLVAAKAYEKDWIISAIKVLPWTDDIAKISERPPIRYALDHNDGGGISALDGRPPKHRPDAEGYKSWLVVTLSSGATFEGWPAYYSIGGDEFEVLLSPACRVEGDATIEPIEGVGAGIRDNDISTLVFLDESKSRCYRLFFGAP